MTKKKSVPRKKKSQQLVIPYLGDGFIKTHHPYPGKWSNFTRICFKWVVQPPTIEIHLTLSILGRWRWSSWPKRCQVPNSDFFSSKNCPKKFNMEPEMMVSYGFQVRNLLSQGLIFRVHVKLRGCIHSNSSPSSMFFYVWKLKIGRKWGSQWFLGMEEGRLHPQKLTCPLKRDYFNRKYIF